MLLLDDKGSNVSIITEVRNKPIKYDSIDGVINVGIKEFIETSNKISIVPVDANPPVAKDELLVSYALHDASCLRVVDCEHTVPVLRNSVSVIRTSIHGRNLSRGFVIESICKESKIGMYAFIPWYGSVPKVCGWYKLVRDDDGRTARYFFAADKYDGADLIDYPSVIPDSLGDIDQANLVIMSVFKKLKSEAVVYPTLFELLNRMNTLLCESIDPPYMLKVMNTISAIHNGVIE